MTLKLAEKVHLVDNVWAFRFHPSSPLRWVAGQFIQVDLPHSHPDDEGTSRWFTISSAPYEKIVQITTRVTDTTFKQALAAMPIGGELRLLEMPDGDFVWEETTKPVLFIAGGIGITPFYSIIKQRVHDRLPLSVSLVYSGRTDQLPFKDEFAAWAAVDPRFRVEYVIGERLTAEGLVRAYPNLTEMLVYVSGPEPMVESLGDQLKAAGLPEAQLKQDFFPHYTEKNF